MEDQPSLCLRHTQASLCWGLLTVSAPQPKQSPSQPMDCSSSQPAFPAAHSPSSSKAGLYPPVGAELEVLLGGFLKRPNACYWRGWNKNYELRILEIGSWLKTNQPSNKQPFTTQTQRNKLSLEIWERPEKCRTIGRESEMAEGTCSNQWNQEGLWNV